MIKNRILAIFISIFLLFAGIAAITAISKEISKTNVETPLPDLTINVEIKNFRFCYIVFIIIGNEGDAPITSDSPIVYRFEEPGGIRWHCDFRNRDGPLNPGEYICHRYIVDEQYMGKDISVIVDPDPNDVNDYPTDWLILDNPETDFGIIEESQENNNELIKELPKTKCLKLFMPGLLSNLLRSILKNTI